MNHVFAVHTMGRVGSRTLAHSLFGSGYACVHTHNFGGDVNPYELTTKYLLESYIHYDTKLWILSPIRDFVSRNLSVYCHTTQHPNLEGFLRYPSTAPEAWIRKELEGYWGVPVLGSPFGKDLGWSSYVVPKSNAELIIFQLERIETAWPQIWKYMKVNRRTALTIRRVGESHTPVYKNWRLPEDYVDRVYAGLPAQTFYSESDLETFRRKHVKS